MQLLYRNKTPEVIEQLVDISGGLIHDRPLTKNVLLGLIDQTSHPNTTKKTVLIDEVEDNWLPRAHSDLSVRRLRLKDLWPHFSPKTRDFASYLTDLDLILTTNLLIWIELWGTKWGHYLRHRGWFNSISSFISATSTISSQVKRYPGTSVYKSMFAEMNVLTGYLQNDLEPTDWHDKLKDLANGGNDHSDSWEVDFKTHLDNVVTNYSTKQFTTLKQYIESGVWITSGSSSIGKVQWSKGTEHGKFKARKNMLTTIMTSDELLTLVQEWDGRLESKGFTKDELSKRRIAVASNIQAYLSESYVLYNLGHIYKNWKYITLDESPSEQHNRNVKMCDLLSEGQWALPFDFKNFDHQPTTHDITTIFDKCVSLIRVPAVFRAEWKSITNKIRDSYHNSTIEMTMNGKTYKETVSGGLPSGVRLTSLLGNVWNATVTDMARTRANHVAGYQLPLEIGVRGDDTYILSPDPAILFLFRLSYESVNAIGLDSKFGISQTTCEFLRNEIGDRSVVGWPNRSIPSITQRKPWNPMPWDLFSDPTTVSNNIYTLERRLRPCEWLHSANMLKWAKFTGQSFRWLQLPRHMGGAGLYPFEGYIPSSCLPKFELPSISFSNKIQPHPPLDWIDLTESQLVDLNTKLLTAKLATDDVQGVQHAIRSNYLAKVRSTNITWSRTLIHKPLKLLSRCDGPSPTDKFVRFPYFPETNIEAIQLIRLYPYVAKVAQIPPLSEVLKSKYTSFYSVMRGFERSGWHRTDAINLANGQIPTEPLKKLHPILAPYVRRYIKAKGCLYWRGRKNISRNIITASNAAVTSLLSQPTVNMYKF